MAAVRSIDVVGVAASARLREPLVRLGIASAAIFALLSALAEDDGPVLCPLRRCSGGYCPACGLTRAGGRLLRGDLAGSWHHHPYLLIMLGQAAVVAAVATAAWRFASTVARRRIASLVRPVVVANISLLTVVWVVRMADGSIPVPFAG